MPEREAMEQRLLEDEGKRRCGVGLVVDEVKRVGFVAGPMVAVNFSHYFLQMVSEMMVGHLGELWLSSTAISISFCAVTGFSVLFGMSSALETLSGQAYGAHQYKNLGTQTLTAIVSLLLTSIPLSLPWLFLENILIFLNQDPQIAHQSANFTLCLIPALFAYATLQPLVRYYQMQSLVAPLLASSCATFCFHVVISWALVFESGLGSLGAALAIGVSYWFNVIVLGLYMGLSPACERTRVRVSVEVFRGVGEFFRFSVPSAVMICLEWWSFEVLTLLSGLLPNPKLETSVLAMCLATVSALYPIPEGLGAAASVRVSNELGAGNARAARLAAHTVVALAVAEAVIVSSMLYTSRRVFGFVFSEEEEVVSYVTSMAPFLCLSVVLDSLQGVFSGIARGCGWQEMGAYVNLGAYYVVGIPVAIALAFWFGLNGKGLWIGILVGSFLQTTLLFIVTCCINWEKQATMARERILERRSSENYLK